MNLGLIAGVSTAFLGWKLGTTAALLVLTLICSYVPYGIRSRVKNSKTVLSYLNCLAGGVVLGALLMHLLPELSESGHHHVSEKSHKHDSSCKGHSHGEKKHFNNDFETDSSTCCGLEGHNGSSGCCGTCAHADHDHKPHEDNHGNTIKKQSSNGGKAKKHSHKKDKHSHAHGHDHHDHGFQYGYFFAGFSFLGLLAIDRLFMHSHSHTHDHGNDHSTKSMKEKEDGSKVEKGEVEQTHHVHSQCLDIECGGKIHSADPEDDDCASCHSEELMGGCHMDGLDENSSKTQAIVFVIALSMHSFLEGLGMATKSTRESLILYMVSLFAHKWLEAFALGVNVMNAKFSTIQSFFLIAFYSLLTPVGIVIGIGFEQLTMDGPYFALTMTILNGLAVGSFLFVSCIEMIPPEFHKKTRHTIWKFFCVCLGFAFMAGISLLHVH